MPPLIPAVRILISVALVRDFFHGYVVAAVPPNGK